MSSFKDFLILIWSFCNTGIFLGAHILGMPYRFPVAEHQRLGYWATFRSYFGAHRLILPIHHRLSGHHEVTFRGMSISVNLCGCPKQRDMTSVSYFSTNCLSEMLMGIDWKNLTAADFFHYRPAHNVIFRVQETCKLLYRLSCS